MRMTITAWTLRRTALSAMLAVGAGACEHAANLEPLSPRTAPAASAGSREMEALLTAVQREMRVQGAADPAREQLIATLLAAAREPAPARSEEDRPAAAVPAHMEHALSRLLAAKGDSAVMVSALQELVDRDTRTP